MIELPTPCHIIDLDALRQNLERVSEFKRISKCDVYLAVKGFSAPYLFGELKDTLDGVSASGLYEAKLGHEHFGKHVQTYSPAFREDQIDEVLCFSDTVVFNSIAQLNRYSEKAREAHCSYGIRINPLFTEIDKNDVNPCRENSHLGIPITALSREVLHSVDGIHIHAMCEQGADALEHLVEYLTAVLGDDLSDLKWINLGGGQLIGHPDYDMKRAADCICRLQEKYGIHVLLEPCEGIFSECGSFAAKVLDIIENNGRIAILDASPICHMQDAVFRGWIREIVGETDRGYTYLLCGQTCFAGDRFGWYSFEKPLQINDVLTFKDTATYTWVKNNAFNGIPFPTICTYSRDEGYHIIKKYTYEDFYHIL